jgi:hypothetical protein
MARTSEFDPVVVDSALSLDRLAELLAMARESAKLDYKLMYDASDRNSRVRLSKHILAMANTAGGYLVLGASDNGGRVGLTPEIVERLDEADLRHQIGTFSTVPISLFLANG